MNSPEQPNLERLVRAALRDLPLRRAPNSLEQRVQAEIARRAALPWWRQSFVHWPTVVQTAFVVLCLGAIKVVLMATMWLSSAIDTVQFRAAFATELRWAHSGLQLLNTAADVGDMLMRSIPPLWLYGGAAIIVALYLALFGLGAAAYRTLYTHSS